MGIIYTGMRTTMKKEYLLVVKVIHLLLTWNFMNSKKSTIRRKFFKKYQYFGSGTVRIPAISKNHRFREHVLEHFHGKTDRNHHMPQTAIIVGYIDAYIIRNVWKCFLCVQCVRKVNITCLRRQFRAFAASQDLM